MVDKIRKIIKVSSVLIFLMYMQICCAYKCLLIPWWHVWSSTFLICYFLWKVIWKILNLNRYKPITIIRVYFWGCLCEFVKNFSMQLQQEKHQYLWHSNLAADLQLCVKYGFLQLPCNNACKIVFMQNYVQSIPFKLCMRQCL